jgi:hypothetical protein
MSILVSALRRQSTGLLYSASNIFFGRNRHITLVRFQILLTWVWSCQTFSKRSLYRKRRELLKQLSFLKKCKQKVGCGVRKEAGNTLAQHKGLFVTRVAMTKHRSVLVQQGKATVNPNLHCTTFIIWTRKAKVASHADCFPGIEPRHSIPLQGIVQCKF